MSDPHPADLYLNYMFGFHAGAGVKTIDPKRANHAEATMRKAYNDGWLDGRKAGRKASKMASKRYRYTPSVLRTMGEAV